MTTSIKHCFIRKLKINKKSIIDRLSLGVVACLGKDSNHFTKK